MNAYGASSIGMWPTPGIATVRAPSASASGGPFEAPSRSCSPQTPEPVQPPAARATAGRARRGTRSPLRRRRRRPLRRAASASPCRGRGRPAATWPRTTRTRATARFPGARRPTPTAAGDASSARPTGISQRGTCTSSGAPPIGETGISAATGRCAAQWTATAEPSEWPATIGRVTPTASQASAIRWAQSARSKGRSGSDPPCPGKSTSTTVWPAASRRARGRQ